MTQQSMNRSVPLFWDHIFQVVGAVLALNVEHLAGVDDADSGLAADHLVTNLVYHISLDQWLLVDQIPLGLVDLIRVGAV